MKTQKTITIITVILLVAIIAATSFVGIYKKEEYRVRNIVKDYTLGMEFTDSRVVSLEVDKEENSEEVLTVENYEKTETIIKNRLTVVTYDSTVDVSIKQNYLTQTYMINLFKKARD